MEGQHLGAVQHAENLAIDLFETTGAHWDPLPGNLE